MPGKIIEAIKRCGVNNPVIIIDEIDKISTRSIMGNTQSALLEILDPATNSSFEDE